MLDIDRFTLCREKSLPLNPAHEKEYMIQDALYACITAEDVLLETELK